MKKTILIILVFAGVFACGAVVGGALTFRFRDSFVEERGAGKFAGDQWRELAEKLDLTAEQKKKMRPIFRRFSEDQQATRKQGQIIMERLRADLEALLTPDQLKKYREFRAQQSQRERERRLKDRELRGGDGGPGPGAGGMLKSLRERRLENQERDERRDERRPEPAPERQPPDTAPPPAYPTPPPAPAAP
jgi:Spy/CpxP family protein refolding chaperone